MEQSLQVLMLKLGAIGIDNLECQEFETGVRGLKTKQDFKAKDLISTLPIKYCFSFRDALDHPTIGTSLGCISHKPDDCLALLLIYYRSLKGMDMSTDATADMGFAEQKECLGIFHSRTLPTTYTNSIFYSNQVLQLSKGSSLYQNTRLLLQQIEQDFEYLERTVLRKNPSVYDAKIFTITNYKWALCTIWSRCMDFQFSGEILVRYLVPFFDLINGSNHVEQCHAYDVQNDCIQLFAGKNYVSGDQIFINYGRLSNSRLLRLYGFTYIMNIHDSYELYLNTDANAPLYSIKTELFNMFRMNAAYSVSLSLDEPLPQKLLLYLRIQRATSIDIPILARQSSTKVYSAVSESNEREVLSSLLAAIDEIIKDFSLGITQLKFLLNTTDEGSPTWSCIQCSMGELEILKRTQVEIIKLNDNH